MSTSNTNEKKNDKIRPREENSKEEKPNKKQKLGDPDASSEKPKPELPEPVLSLFEEITNVRFFMHFFVIIPAFLRQNSDRQFCGSSLRPYKRLTD